MIFFWKKKFIIKEDKQKSIRDIGRNYRKESWIIEGTTEYLLMPRLKRADLIIYLG